MFDNFKARMKKLEEDHESIHKVVQHVEEHKMAYVAGASGVGCLIIGGTAGSIFGREVLVKPIAKNAMLMGYKSPQSIVQETIVHVSAKGERGHVIIDAVTGVPVGRSLREAATNEGISRTALRETCRGLRDVAPNGKKYIDLGENLSEELRIAL